MQGALQWLGNGEEEVEGSDQWLPTHYKAYNPQKSQKYVFRYYAVMEDEDGERK